MALAFDRQCYPSDIKICDYPMVDMLSDNECWNSCIEDSFDIEPSAGLDHASVSDVRPFEPALPSEVVLLIFEAGAASSKPEAAMLSVVSRAARAVALPHLFRTLILQKRKYAYAVAHFLRQHPHISKFVRAIWMRESTAADSALLAACPRVDNTAVLPACLAQYCALGNLYFGLHANSIGNAPYTTPKQLVLFPGCCDWLDFDMNAPFTRAYFYKLTHMWLTQPAQLQALVKRRRVISTMTSLTHLAVPWYGDSSIPSNIFHLLPSLRTLVVVVLPKPASGPSIRGLRAGHQESVGFPLDKRIRLYAFLDDSTDNSVFPLWKEHCFRGRSIWDVAVKIIRPS